MKQHPSLRRSFFFGFVILSACAIAGAPPATAQTVHPDLSLEQPQAGLSVQADYLRGGEAPRIGVFLSEQAVALNPAYDPVLRETVRQWEYFLLGHELSYRVLGDSAMSSELPASMRLLILPGAEVLSNVQKDVIRHFLKRGGGVIASGRIGFYSDLGVLQNDRFFTEIVGGEPSIDLPDTLQGLVQTLNGGHWLTEGLPAGFPLNVSRPAFGFGAFAVKSRTVGTLGAYQPMDVSLIEQAVDASTLILYGNYEAGRVVWFGFGPQDVSREARQQAVYQGLVLNAMAYATKTPALSLRRWPFGYSSASAFAVLPSSAYRPYAFRSSFDLVHRALDEAALPATAFFVADQATNHPDLVTRWGRNREIALAGNSTELLFGLPYSLQQDRVQMASTVLNRLDPEPVSGMYAPGGYYDVHTYRTALDAGMTYVLTNEQRLYEPAELPWEELLDYRDTLLADVPHRPFTSAYSFVSPDSSATPRRHLTGFYPTLFSYEVTNRPLPEHGDAKQVWYDALRSSFDKIHAAEGLFLFAFDAETVGMSARRTTALVEAGRYMREKKSWQATLRDIQTWRLDRDHVSVRFLPPSSASYEFAVENGGGESVAGVSISFWYDAALHGKLQLEAGALDVTSTTLSDKIVLVIQSLPPGKHTIRLVASESLTMQ